MYTVLLFYKFINIDDPEKVRSEQEEFCYKHGFKGRILVGKEGINGTLSGTQESCQNYMVFTESQVGKIDWKLSNTTLQDIFPKLKVKVRPEIVTFGTKVNMNNKAQYLEPHELKQMYDNNEDFLILDGRNEYEARIGRFKNAVIPDIEHFRDFPAWFQKNKDIFKNKKVVTYCTGGIRCEKLSAYLIDQGVENVYQLHGGIHRYSDEVSGENFEGEMYVFDGRVHVPVNFVNPSICSECVYCNKKIARYKNCTNCRCNKQIILCEQCENKNKGLCNDCIKSGY